MTADTARTAAGAAQPSLDAAVAAWQSHGSVDGGSRPGTAGLALAKQALDAGRADLAVQVLRDLTARMPDWDQAWQLLGFAHREEQNMAEAVRAFERAAALRPDDPQSALGVAHTHQEIGSPAAHLFRRVLELTPTNPRALRGYALALAAEGQTAEAERLLDQALTAQPEWLEGHRSLAALRWTLGGSQGGRNQDFARSYAAACRTQPANLALRLAWFRAVAQTRHWEAARSIIADGEGLFGPVQAFTVARLFIASESGERAEADRLFAATETVRDTVRDLAYVRHNLRTGRPDAALPVAERLLRTPNAPAVWPYLSVIWRLRGDSRVEWLDGAPPFIRSVELDFSNAEREELAALLRRLHTAEAPFLEQSVRGGTQTDGQLFLRAEPIIQATRAKVEAGLREYLAGLPPAVAGHPLLGTPRAGRLTYTGSWSVRLQGGGYHVSHTHPMGWISSALYIDLPPAQQRGAAPAGWIAFGAPPPELGVELPEYGRIEPQPGRLVLFPSTMWHRTVPFEAGERLVVAFDVRAPRV